MPDLYYKVTRRLVLSFSKRVVLNAIRSARGRVTKSDLTFTGESIRPFIPSCSARRADIHRDVAIVCSVGIRARQQVSNTQKRTRRRISFGARIRCLSTSRIPRRYVPQLYVVCVQISLMCVSVRVRAQSSSFLVRPWPLLVSRRRRTATTL